MFQPLIFRGVPGDRNHHHYIYFNALCYVLRPSLGPGMVPTNFRKLGTSICQALFVQKSPGMIFQEGMQAAHSAKFLTWHVDLTASLTCPIFPVEV